MSRIIIIIIVRLLVINDAKGQFTATDIRNASGCGPFPIYLNAQLLIPGAGNLFGEFVDEYTNQNGGKSKEYLHGFEFNTGIVINDDHLFGIKNLKIKGLSFEMGYRYMYRNIISDLDERLHLQEESVSLRLGYRLCILYPITLQVQTGPTIYNFLSVNETNDLSGEFLRYREGYGLFERVDDRSDFPSGWEIRGRVVLFDPAGTEGGLGVYIEYRYLWTKGSRNLKGLYDIILPELDKVTSSQPWDYGMFSLGVVTPLAKRMVSN